MLHGAVFESSWSYLGASVQRPARRSVVFEQFRVFRPHVSGGLARLTCVPMQFLREGNDMGQADDRRPSPAVQAWRARVGNMPPRWARTLSSAPSAWRPSASVGRHRLGVGSWSVFWGSAHESGDCLCGAFRCPRAIVGARAPTMVMLWVHFASVGAHP